MYHKGADACGTQSLGSPATGFRGSVRCLMCVLGTEPRSAVLLTAEPFLLFLIQFNVSEAVYLQLLFDPLGIVLVYFLISWFVVVVVVVF